MIERYARAEMTEIWSAATKYRIWFEIEAHGCDALAELGVIPKSAAENIWERGGSAEFNVAKIDTIEREVKHDVIAFLTHLAEFIGEDARFVHQGFTSSDILDTTLSVQLARATDLLLIGMDRVLAALKKRATEHKHTITIGRSHAIHAEPTTFGVKLARFYAEFARGRERLVIARKEIAVCAISGAIGTFANIDPKVEEHVAKKMDLAIEPVSSQIIPRDRHAAYFAALGVIASSIENIAVEIRHLQRTEVLEAEEFFSKGQKGSSAMPHKRNPVLTENLTGLARLVRMAVTPAMENVALWHERDISHSSVERGIGPDAPEKMKANMDRLGGLHNSQRFLLALTQAGEQRESAYRLVQRNAMKVWEMFRTEGNAGEGSFLNLILADKDVMALLSEDQVRAMFDDEYHIKHVETIFDRVFT